jgi:outer membrane receptor protein involved in Fe transport
VGTWTWQLPFFREEKGLGRVLGGWEISGIGRYQSGPPLTVTANTSIGTRRADFLGGDPYLPPSQRFDPTSPGVVRWMDSAAFVIAPEAGRGNSKRGQFRGPSLKVLDISLRKGFAVSGPVKLQIQADLFNILNQTNLRFGNQTLVLTGGGFGQLNTAAPPRNVQLGMRVTF